MKEKLKSIPFRPGPGLPVYFLLLLICLVATQALRSTVSAMLMYLIISVFPLGLIYLITGILAVHPYLAVEKTRVCKMEEVTYQIELVNHAWIPFPVVEVYQCVPRDDGVRCIDQKVVLCLLPSGVFHFDGRAVFRFRGTYEIGITSVVITDLFRLFSYTKQEQLYYTILVSPRQLGITEAHRVAQTDDSSLSNRRKIGETATQISDVREYREGDLLRNIHWKLSGKKDDLVVKDYQSNEDVNAYLVVDFSEKSSPVLDEVHPTTKEKNKEIRTKKRKKKKVIFAHLEEERIKGKNRRQIKIEKRMAKEKNRWLHSQKKEKQPLSSDYVIPSFADEENERIADGVCEIAIARLLQKLREGKACHLIWYDRRKDQPVCHRVLSSMEDLEEIYQDFTTTPLCPPCDSLATLFGQIDEKQNRTIHLFSGHSDEILLRKIETLSRETGDSFGSYIEWLFYHPLEIYAFPEERNRELSAVKSRMASCGVDMKTVESLSTEDKSTSFFTY